MRGTMHQTIFAMTLLLLATACGSLSKGASFVGDWATNSATATIPSIIETVLDAHTPKHAFSLEAILGADAWGREEARKLTHRLCQA